MLLRVQVHPSEGGGRRKSSRSSSRSLASRVIDSPASTLGTSIIAFHDDTAFESLCGVSCRDGTGFCIKGRNCSIQSHRGRPQFPGLKPGIYVKSKDSQRVKEAHALPVGDLSLLTHHKEVLMSTSNKNLSFWRMSFDELRSVQDKDEGSNLLKAIAQRLTGRRRVVPDPASVDLTSDEIEDPSDEPFDAVPNQIVASHPIPGGIDDRPLSLQEAEALVAEAPREPDLQEDILLNFLIKAGPQFDSDMPPYCQIPHFVVQSYRAARSLVEVSNELHQKSNQLGLQLEENMTAVAKINETNVQMIKPIKSTFKEKNVWKVLELLSNEVQVLKTKDAKSTSFLYEANQKIKQLEIENNEIEARFEKELNDIK